MTTQDTLVKYLTDMYSLEKHLHQPLKAQADDADFGPYAEARTLVQKIEMRTGHAITALEAQIKEMGGDARSSFKSAVTAAAGVVAAAVNEGRTHAITKKLRDDYTALALVSVGYELLYTTATALGSPTVASLAMRELKDVASHIMELSQVIIPVAVAELARTNPEANTGTAVASQQAIQDAWRSRSKS
jgi:ferritin-like metal-binding protein YciE